MSRLALVALVVLAPGVAGCDGNPPTTEDAPFAGTMTASVNGAAWTADEPVTCGVLDGRFWTAAGKSSIIDGYPHLLVFSMYAPTPTPGEPYPLAWQGLDPPLRGAQSVEFEDDLILETHKGAQGDEGGTLVVEAFEPGGRVTGRFETVLVRDIDLGADGRPLPPSGQLPDTVRVESGRFECDQSYRGGL